MRRDLTTDWTQERCDLLRHLRLQNTKFSEIAALMGLSRNAVIGKANRMGLTKRRPAVPQYKGLKGCDAVAEMMADDRRIVFDWSELGFRNPLHAKHWRDRVAGEMGEIVR